MRALVFALCLFAAVPAPAPARNLCGLGDREDILAAISGTWIADEAISLENETTSLLRFPDPAQEVVTPEGSLATPFLDELTGGPMALSLARPKPYDVDRVDGVLETTGRASFADLLSDTLCGPEDLPQLVARVDALGGTGATGTVTLVAYFDDRMLRISEMTLRQDGTVLFMVATALLRRE
jgi:hypothetical protein